MSGKFVPAGSSDQVTDRDKDWLQAQQELNDKQKERENQKPEDAGKSLYEVLQANKAAKEEAFQESIKLKNQFRALNDDEIDFLDAHVDAVRAKDQAIRKDTDEQLKLFRQKQDAASKIDADLLGAPENGTDDAVADLEITWTTTRKRKRINEKNTTKNSKLQRSTSDASLNPTTGKSELLTKEKISNQKDIEASAKPNSNVTTTAVTTKPGLSLVDYGSDEDSDS